MLPKILAMSWKEVYTTYSDRNTLLILIATPLVLATIIGLAFSGFLNSGGNDVPISDIPFALVNLDQGAAGFDGEQNMGQVFVDLLVDGAADDQPDVLLQLTNAELMTDPDAARNRVETGELAAAVIIPADFTANITYSPTHLTIDPTTIEIYASAGMQISASVVRSIITSIGGQIATGNTAIAVTIDALTARAQDDPATALQLLTNFEPDFAPAFTPENSPIRIESETVTGEAVSFNPLAYFGATLSIMFMLFTARASAGDLLVERQTGTFDRLMTTPTPRIVILLGKLAGTFITCVLQLILLFVFLTLVGSLLSGGFQMLWGANIGAVLLVIVAVSLAASGFGALLTSLVRNEQQGDVVGTVIILAMSVLSGAFFNVDQVAALNTLRRFTLNFWGTDALVRLSQEQADIGTHVVVLLLFGAVTFFIGLFIFNRRLEV